MIRSVSKTVARRADERPMREALARRFWRAWLLEWLNGLVVFPFVYLSLAGSVWHSPLSLYAMAVCSAVLLTCGYYWRVKASEIRGRGVRGDVIRLYARLRWGLLGLVVSVPLLGSVAWALPVWSPGSRDLLLASAFGAFALLEYINYYHLQLMYFDSIREVRHLVTNKRLKAGILARGLASAPRSR